MSFADDKEMDEKSKRDQEKKSKPKKSRLGPIISPDVIGIERNVETKDGTKKIVEKVPGKPEEPKAEDKMTEGSGGKDENSDSRKVDTGANKRPVSKLIQKSYISSSFFPKGVAFEDPL